VRQTHQFWVGWVGVVSDVGCEDARFVSEQAFLRMRDVSMNWGALK
jgi:hypothetical protein